MALVLPPRVLGLSSGSVHVGVEPALIYEAL
jgi:hypothetical protein